MFEQIQSFHCDILVDEDIVGIVKYSFFKNII